MFPVTFRRRASITLLLVLAFAVAAVGHARQESEEENGAALRVFEARIGDYAALHRRLESHLSEPTPAEGLEAFLLSRAQLASAIKAARPAAREGDVFTPAVAQAFRRVIAVALAGRDVEAMLCDLYEEHETVRGFRARVHDPYPGWATHEMPVILLQQLPRLPEDVEYRLIDRDLLLWDLHADLIVDVLPHAIPRGPVWFDCQGWHRPSPAERRASARVRAANSSCASTVQLEVRVL